MKKLPNNFVSALIDIKKKIKNFGKEEGYLEVIKNYNKINKIFELHECYIPDIEKTLSKYKLPDDTVSKLRSLTTRRNEYIYQKSLKSQKMTDLIKKLTKEYSNHFEKISEKQVKSLIHKLLKKRCNGWAGPWTMIEVGNKGSIKNIELFDLKDKNYITRGLGKKLKKLF